MILMHFLQEEEIKEQELQLEIRSKDLKTQEAMLFSQVLYLNSDVGVFQFVYIASIVWL